MRHEYQLCSYRAHHYEQHLCICLSRDPTELPEQVIGLNKFMHLLYLCILFSVFGFLGIVISNNNKKKVYQLFQLTAISKCFYQSCWRSNLAMEKMMGFDWSSNDHCK
ncbi:hypothetical protein PR202_gb16036 [Eleusine coracana subsp. coracana]|uniref:Uncharacterized protein n=1 Tax=Eleusine coracana subsp. coracana TaxID=191504 RepID=A0AAV5EZD7_ELECO|nr:hypothetical protein PR202_gb16036 [Eleusine coracana subsp. coracana]